jgi:hypothetical protein
LVDILKSKTYPVTISAPFFKSLSIAEAFLLIKACPIGDTCYAFTLFTLTLLARSRSKLSRDI